jgi:hypothetical protein
MSLIIYDKYEFEIKDSIWLIINLEPVLVKINHFSLFGLLYNSNKTMLKKYL